MAASAPDLGTGVLEMFAGLEDDERLAGQGLAVAFAAAFPDLPADSDIPGLTSSTGWARVAGLLGVEPLKILDVVQANAMHWPNGRCGGRAVAAPWCLNWLGRGGRPT